MQLYLNQLNLVQLSSTYLGSLQLGSTQHNSTWFNSTQLNSTQLGSTSLLNFTWSSTSTSCHRRMRITRRSNGSGLLRIAQIKLVANRIRLAQPIHTTNHRSQVTTTTTNHKPHTTNHSHKPHTTHHTPQLTQHHTPQTTSSPTPHPPPMTIAHTAVEKRGRIPTGGVGGFSAAREREAGCDVRTGKPPRKKWRVREAVHSQ